MAQKKKIWFIFANTFHITKVIEGVFDPETSLYWDDTGDIECEGLGHRLGNSSGTWTFASSDKHEVETFRQGALWTIYLMQQTIAGLPINKELKLEYNQDD